MSQTIGELLTCSVPLALGWALSGILMALTGPKLRTEEAGAPRMELWVPPVVWHFVGGLVLCLLFRSIGLIYPNVGTMALCLVFLPILSSLILLPFQVSALIASRKHGITGPSGQSSTGVYRSKLGLVLVGGTTLLGVLTALRLDIVEPGGIFDHIPPAIKQRAAADQSEQPRSVRT